MTWISVIGSILYYVLLPITALFKSLLLLLAPLTHMGHYILSGFLIPLRLIAKFETLYIYLGVAAVIGLFTGSILHFTSTMLVSLFNLTPTSEENGRTAASVRKAREQQKLEDIWRSSSFGGGQGRLKADPFLERNYPEWPDTSASKRREDPRLVKQTILEEDDDSEEGF